MFIMEIDFASQKVSKNISIASLNSSHGAMACRLCWVMWDFALYSFTHREIQFDEYVVNQSNQSA